MAEADENEDGCVDWREFLPAFLPLLRSAQVPLHTLMTTILSDSRISWRLTFETTCDWCSSTAFTWPGA
jgi:hypothetical protein